MPTFKIVIKGKVQGVFYRATAKDIAKNLGITGWIKNTAAGDVEAMVSGAESPLQEFVSWCKKGPGKAVVDKVEVIEKEEILFNEFVVVR